jgi:hypothetical protein
MTLAGYCREHPCVRVLPVLMRFQPDKSCARKHWPWAESVSAVGFPGDRLGAVFMVGKNPRRARDSVPGLLAHWPFGSAIALPPDEVADEAILIAALDQRLVQAARHRRQHGKSRRRDRLRGWAYRIRTSMCGENIHLFEE